MFKKKRVVVLGAGPAGLLAAHAAERAGRDVTVFTAPDLAGQPKKSELHGCQYLHAAIPGLAAFKGHPVSYLLEGTRDGYRRKVYGDAWQGETSVDEYGPEKGHMAWDLRAAYDMLWERWERRISALSFTPELAYRMSQVGGQTVLCTVPAPALCIRPNDHKFPTQDIWAMGTRDIPNGHSRSEPYYTLPFTAGPMTVLCNGNDAPRWYRAATVFGQSTLEWPSGPRPPISGVARVQKPLSTDCDCHVGAQWHRLGRYGRWQKGYLVHQAYADTEELL